MPRPAVRLLLTAQAMLLLPASPQAASTLLLPAVDSPAGGGGSVVLEPVRPRAQPTRRLVYSCVAPGLVTFSDRPCGPRQEVRELKLEQPLPAAAGGSPGPGTVDAQAPASRRKTAEQDGDGATAAETERVTTCQKLQAVLDRLDSRMRAGYTAREAGSLWERWRDAKARLHAADC
jgi:hypothetical protein